MRKRYEGQTIVCCDCKQTVPRTASNQVRCGDCREKKRLEDYRKHSAYAHQPLEVVEKPRQELDTEDRAQRAAWHLSHIPEDLWGHVLEDARRRRAFREKAKPAPPTLPALNPPPPWMTIG